jgi:glycosyltransferase 2 family protein
LKKALINILKFALPLALGIFLIWYISKSLSSSDKEDISRSFKTANYSWILLAFLFGILSHLSRAHRWLLLLRQMNYKPKLSNSFYCIMIGYLANFAFPRLGEVTRCGVMGKYEKIPFDKLFGSVLAERIIDLIILLILFCITIFSQWTLLSDFIRKNLLTGIYSKLEGSGDKLFWLGIIGLSMFAGFVIAFYLFRTQARTLYEKIKNALSGFAEGLKTVMRLKEKKLFIFHTLFIWVMYILMLYVSIFSLPETSGLGAGAILSAFIFGTFGIIAVQGGIGAYPALIMQTLILYGISKSAGFAFGWISWAGQTAGIIIVGIISLILITVTNKKYEQTRSNQGQNSHN